MMPRERDPLVVGRVIGDVLDSFTKSINLSVSYNDREVSNGCELKPSQVVNQPRVDIGGDDLRAFHTLVRFALFSYVNSFLLSFELIFQFKFLFKTITKRFLAILLLI